MCQFHIENLTLNEVQIKIFVEVLKFLSMLFLHQSIAHSSVSCRSLIVVRTSERKAASTNKKQANKIFRLLNKSIKHIKMKVSLVSACI